jgi:hypothetical protein
MCRGLLPARRPVRPRRCRNEATLGGSLTWMTRSRSPTSIPSSSVEVATMTQSRASANASSARRRSSSGSEAWDRNVVTPRSRSAAPICSTSCRESKFRHRQAPDQDHQGTQLAGRLLPETASCPMRAQLLLHPALRRYRHSSGSRGSMDWAGPRGAPSRLRPRAHRRRAAYMAHARQPAQHRTRPTQPHALASNWRDPILTS